MTRIATQSRHGASWASFVVCPKSSSLAFMLAKRVIPLRCCFTMRVIPHISSQSASWESLFYRNSRYSYDLLFTKLIMGQTICRKARHGDCCFRTVRHGGFVLTQSPSWEALFVEKRVMIGLNRLSQSASQGLVFCYQARIYYDLLVAKRAISIC